MVTTNDQTPLEHVYLSKRMLSHGSHRMGARGRPPISLLSFLYNGEHMAMSAISKKNIKPVKNILKKKFLIMQTLLLNPYEQHF